MIAASHDTAFSCIVIIISLASKETIVSLPAADSSGFCIYINGEEGEKRTVLTKTSSSHGNHDKDYNNDLNKNDKDNVMRRGGWG